MRKSFIGLIAALGAAFGAAVCTFALLLFAGAKLLANRAGFHGLLFLVPLIALLTTGAVFSIVFREVRSKQNS
jgi:hypothetical protein